MISGERDGAPVPSEVAELTELTFFAGKYDVRFNAQVADRSTYELGGAAAPCTFTLHSEGGPNAARTISYVYQLVSNRLRVCYRLDGVAPTDFITANRHRHLATYQRTTA